jgi:hypothetical protein
MWSFEEPFEIREINGSIRGLLKSTWELDRLAIVLIESCFERTGERAPQHIRLLKQSLRYGEHVILNLVKKSIE